MIITHALSIFSCFQDRHFRRRGSASWCTMSVSGGAGLVPRLLNGAETFGRKMLALTLTKYIKLRLAVSGVKARCLREIGGPNRNWKQFVFSGCFCWLALQLTLAFNALFKILLVVSARLTPAKVVLTPRICSVTCIMCSII